MRLKAIKFAETLNSIGIGCEDNMTIISGHHDDLVSVLIGSSAIGAIINPLDPSFSICKSSPNLAPTMEQESKTSIKQTR